LSRRDRRTAIIFTLILACLSLSGVLCVVATRPAAGQALPGDDTDAWGNLAFSAESDLVSLTLQNGVLRIEWPQTGVGGARVAARTFPLPRQTTRLQADMTIGGLQNASGRERSGYVVWFEAELLSDGRVTDTRRIEIPLESEKNRARIYSLLVSIDDTAADAYRLCLTVEPLNGGIGQGYLTCGDPEVTTR
jgi:hypothetical protein